MIRSRFVLSFISDPFRELRALLRYALEVERDPLAHRRRRDDGPPERIDMPAMRLVGLRVPDPSGQHSRGARRGLALQKREAPEDAEIRSRHLAGGQAREEVGPPVEGVPLDPA